MRLNGIVNDNKKRLVISSDTFIKLIYFGCDRLPQTDFAIYWDYQPAHIAIEQPFINPEFPSTTKLLQVLGVLNLVAYRHGCLPIMIYPTTWKSNLDNPKAEREDIADILEQMFYLNPLKLDAQVDAISIAYAAWCGLGQH